MNLIVMFSFPDINECLVHGTECPQLCNNVKGSFKCECAPEFRDDKGQGKDCKPEGMSRVCELTY